MSTTQPLPSAPPTAPPIANPSSQLPLSLPGGQGSMITPNNVSLGNFIDDAHKAGYGSIDPNIITSIGHQLGNTNQAKLALATVKQSLAIPIKNSQYLYEQSAIVPTQTASKAIQDHFANTGLVPYSIGTIKGFQQQLLDSTYNGTKYTLPGMKVDGLWNADWANAAYNYSLADHAQPGFGNTGARSLFSTVFNPAFLSYAIPLVKSIITAIPSVALKGLGDGLKLATDAVSSFDNFVGGQNTGGVQANSTLTHVANWLSNTGQDVAGKAPLTDPQYGKQGNWEHALNLGNFALMLTGLGGAATETAAAGRGALAAGEAAGATSKLGALFTKIEPMAPKGPLNWIMNSVLPNTADGNARFAFTNWLRNSPAAQQLVPDLRTKAVTGFLNASDSAATGIKNAYQTARRVAATPYNRPITAIGGQAVSAISTAGLKFGIQGHLDNWMGDPNAPVAYQLDHLQPIAGMTGLGLNLLQMVAHGDTGYVPALSERTGNIFAQARSGIATALNRNGLLPDWERGTGVSVNKTIRDLGKQGIHPDEFFAHVMNQADGFAAHRATRPLVDNDISKQLLDPTNHDQIHFAQLNQSSVIRNDPESMAKARDSYMQVPGLFAKDVANSMLEYRESPTKVFSKDLATLILQRRDTQANVIPHLDLFHNPTAFKDDTSWMTATSPERIVQAKQAALSGNSLQGRLGIMRYGLPTAEDAQAKALSFAQELEKAKPGYVAPTTLDGLKASSDGSTFGALDNSYQMPKTHNPDVASPAETELRGRVMNFLASELGRDPQNLNFVPTQDLIKLIAEKSDLLAHDVRLPATAPKSLIDAFARAKENGYKHVWGTDIGHIFHNPPIDLQALGTQQNLLNRYADKLGVNFTPMADETSVSSIGAKNGVNDVIDAKKAQDPTKLPIWATGSRIVDYVQNMIKPEINGAASVAIGASASPIGKLITLKGLSMRNGGAWKNELDALIQKGSYTDDAGKIVDTSTMPRAKVALKELLATDSSPQSWTRKQFIDALSKPSADPELAARGMIKDKFGHEVQFANMSVKDASDLYYGMKKGLRSAPAYQSGTNIIGRLMNSTLGLDNVPLAINGKRLLDITGPIQNSLIQARYLFSPRQAYLRVVKSALKGVNEDMPFSMNARASLESELTLEQQAATKALTEKIYGKNETALDPTAPETKEFASKDYFNIYDPQAVLERTVHYVSQNMASEGKAFDTPAGMSELKSRVDAINNYGERTAAEKSLNGFFFPFSFEKTVVRELGGHLLDNPSTRLMTAGAIHVYNSTQGQKMDKWLKDNVPLWKEVEKFNPFFHGEGLGQFGGINRTPEGIIGKVLYGGGSVPDFSKVSDKDKLGLFLHMMQPKPVTSQASLKALINLAPALKDLNNLFVGYDPNGKKPTQWGGEIYSSVKDLAHQANSAVHTFMGQENTNPYTSQGYQPYDLQQTNAWALRSQYITGLMPALQANAQGGNVKFLTDTPGVGDLKVTRSNINTIIGLIYPKWDSSLAKYSLVRNVAVKQERVNIQSDVRRLGPNLMPMYDNFTQGSDTVQSQLQKAELDPTFNYSNVIADMGTLRYWASYLAAADPNFAAFYAKYYASKYGPLKGL